MLSLELGKVSMVNYFFLASVKKVFGISSVDMKQCHFSISMQKFTVASVEQFCILKGSLVPIHFPCIF